MRRKKAEGSSTSGDGRITPMDVQQVEFRLAFRGYNERDVDAFLDRVTEDLAAYMEENQRLRAGMPVAPATGGAFDGTAARSEADRIVAEARAEAARIVREAEARAAALSAGTGDARAAVAPFLNTEREFLQSLGALVQGHAEEIKQMVLALRSRAEAEAAPPAVPASTADRPAGTDRPTQTPAAPSAEAEEAPATTAEEAFAPISVPEGQTEQDAGPEPEPAPAQVRRDSGDRSLRELFWGED